VLLDLDRVNVVPLNNATNQIVFTENGGAVDKVLIGGKLVVTGGRAIGIDRAALAAQARDGLAALGEAPGQRLTFRGFIVSDFSARYGDFMRDVSAWVREGRIKYREDVVEGLENAPRALIGLLRGENFGKLLVRVAR
jgi:NADPH-dependent curcumin reductase CurA